MAFKTTLGRSALAIGFGSMFAAGITSLLFSVIIGFQAASQGSYSLAPSVGLGAGLLAFVYSLPIWAGGLVVLGVPFWLLLHRRGYREFHHATLLGGVLTFAVVLLLLRIVGSSASGTWMGATIGAAVCAPIGYLTGIFIWYQAYGPSTSENE